VRRWEFDDDEPAWLEIEDDRMKSGDPACVTLWAEQGEHRSQRETLICATPDQAREMAAELLASAKDADRANASLSKDPS
jgi:hypothetical protein